MTSINNFGKIFLTAILITFLFACGQRSTIENEEQAANKISNEPILTIDTISTFPPEIDGCSCYFSNDSLEFTKGKYVYMNDFAQTSFLKINGVLTKFTQTEFKEVNKKITVSKARSDKYEMTIEVINGNENGDETSLKSGKIILKDKNGNTITKAFYGECGC